MKICLINNLYKPLNKGGAERIVELMVDKFNLLKHEAFVITTKPYFYKQDSNSKLKYINSLYFNLARMPKVLRLFWHFFDTFDVVSAYRVYRILKREKPDLVVTHNLKGLSYLIPFFVKLTGIKNVHILHDIQLLHPSGLLIYGDEKLLNTFFARVYQKICCKLFYFSGTIFSPSRWLLDLHADRGYFLNCKKFVIANPAKVERVLPDKKRSDDSFRFLYIGQLEAHKGVKNLIKTFMRFTRDNKFDCSLTLVGDGSLFNELTGMSKDFKNITFCGKKNNEEIMKLMTDHSCLVVPSLCYENSPTVIYEAASAGLPVLAVRLGGITELVHYLGGVLFSPESSDDLLKKMLFVAQNQSVIHGYAKKAIKKIQLFSLDRYIDNILTKVK
jgi:glycosyltransferase involved in cell wall biosynthesis